MTVSKFKVGDRVYAPFHGYGTVTKIHEDKCVYPIIVTWDDTNVPFMEDVSSFTEDGCLSQYFDNDSTVLKVVDKESTQKEKKFKVGDHVISHHFGKGIITEIDTEAKFPIKVKWDDKPHGSLSEFDHFTINGHFGYSSHDPEWDIVPVEKENMGQIAGVIDHNIHNKIDHWGDNFKTEDNEKMGADDEKFHVGDRVYAPFHKYGTIVEIDDTDASYPITVRWDESRYKIGIDLSTFTEDGYLFFGNKTENTKITKIEGEKMDADDESTIERMEDGLNKKVEDAVNPAHYKVKGLPEAIDIINHLMHREQYEGFLWGNIIKYAYRYGRKGDKADTAGKIAWYATQLRELGLCESEGETK